MKSTTHNEELTAILRSKKLKKRGIVSSVIVATLLFHVVAGIIAGAIMIVHEIANEVEDFEEPPVIAAPQKQPEYQVNIQKLKKQSSPPRPRPILVHNPNNITLPALDVPQIKSDISITGRGSGGFGVGIGGGGSPKLNISFFGVKGNVGGRIAFIVDYSNSMRGGGKEKIMRKEIERTISKLPDGVEVALVFFAGRPWNYDEPDGQKGNPKPKDGEKETYKGKFVKLSDTVRKKMIKAIRETKLVGGTVWSTAFMSVLSSRNIPDTIFFMTDGAASKNGGHEPVLERLNEIKKSGKPLPVINTIGMGIKGDKMKGLELLSKRTKGKSKSVAE